MSLTEDMQTAFGRTCKDVKARIKIVACRMFEVPHGGARKDEPFRIWYEKRVCENNQSLLSSLAIHILLAIAGQHEVAASINVDHDDIIEMGAVHEHAVSI